jgi:hypothetical protein
MGRDLVLLTFTFQSLFAFELLKLPLFHLLHALSVRQLSLVELSEVLLLPLHSPKLLLFKDFHASELEGLPTQHGEDGLDFPVELEQFIVLDEGLFVDTTLHRDVERRLLSLYDELGLVPDFIVRCLIRQLLHKLVRLDVDILPTTYWLWGPDVSLEKFL